MRTALVLVVLAGCAAPQPKWEKPGASEYAVKDALQDCHVQLSLSPQPHTMGLGGGRTPGLDRIDERNESDDARFQRCMERKGFSRVP